MRAQVRRSVRLELLAAEQPCFVRQRLADGFIGQVASKDGFKNVDEAVFVGHGEISFVGGGWIGMQPSSRRWPQARGWDRRRGARNYR